MSRKVPVTIALVASGLLALGWSQGATGATERGNGSQQGSLSSTGQRAQDWDPGRYLELYTQAAPRYDMGNPIRAVQQGGDWDPGNYLQYFDAPPVPALPPPELTEVSGSWEPGRYLELYTVR